MGMEMVDKAVEGGEWPMTSLDHFRHLTVRENILSDS